MTGDRVFIIAEAGVNHNGSLDIARQLAEAARDAGADAVKFQSFRAETLVSREAAKAAYQLRETDAKESQFDMLKRLELDAAAHAELMAHCHRIGIGFL
ncbi:N-acetylneuraminate synthase family protein, partial [Petrachloros mirabilis]